MAQLFQHQLQPFEEHQSPSPTHEHPDPFNLSRSRSSSSRNSNQPAESPTSPINTLHRQLSGDPDAPPPAWKRRASFTQKSPNSGQESSGTARSPSQTRPPKISPTGEVISPVRASQPPPSASARRHPALLQMTTTTRPPMPSGLYTHDPSPNASSTSLYDPTFAPPQPAFSRKRGEGGSRSNRSSIHSMDTSGMTSEDLWNLESSESVADLSNPQRNAMERPLDTIRRLSMRSERGTPAVSPYSASALPVDFLWPVAPPEEEQPMQMRRMKSKSTTNVPGAAQRQSRLGRKKTSRQSSADPQMIGKIMDDTPSADNMPRSESVFISSAHSSATDLSKGMPANKSMTSLGSRPPSAYYARDFLSQLAPREGGYAIAAMLSSPSVPGQMSAEERRRSSNLEAARVSRPPTSKSAGMGRWSLDGGEHYNRPYGSASANTTSSNLSAPPINSPDPSPPADEVSQVAMLPEGASPAVNTRNDAGDGIPVPLVASSSAVPTNPSPLSQSVIEAPPTPALDTASIPVPPIPTSSTPPPPGPTLSPKKSKKQLAKEAKAQEKAEAAKVVAARAAKAREETAKRQAEKQAAKKREKEEKERKKMEKKMNKAGGSGIKGSSQPALGSKVPAVAPIPVPPPAPNAAPSTSSTGTSNTAVSSSSSPNIGKQQQPSTTIPIASGERRNVSMPAGQLLHPATSAIKGDQQPKKTKLGLFGTIRKRFSTMDNSSKASLGKAATGRTPIQLDEPTKVVPGPAASSSTQNAVPAESSVSTQSTQADSAIRAVDFSVPDTILSSDASAPVASAEKSDAEPHIAGTQEVDTPSTPARQPTEPVAIRQSEELPPRTSSIHHSSPSPSRTPQPPISSDSHSSPSAGLRSRNSIQGPRPMPRSGSISSRTHSPPTKSVTSIPPQSAPLANGESTGLSQVQSHLTSTSSSGTYDSQTPMTSEEDQEQRLGQGEKMGNGDGEPSKREVAGLDLGRIVAAH